MNIAKTLGAKIHTSAVTTLRGNQRHAEQYFQTPWRESKDGLVRFKATVRLDDRCSNAHDTCSITGEGQYKRDSMDLWQEGYGCIHEEIASVFPELAPFIKWHLTSTDGPAHYVADSTYHATNRENGKLAGEVLSYENRLKFKDFPITFAAEQAFQEFLMSPRGACKPVAVSYVSRPGETYDFKPKYTFEGYDVKWHACPFDSLVKAEEFAEAVHTYGVEVVSVPDRISRGKERDLDAARSCAIWPEATDEELCSDNLADLLRARHPALMAEFKADMISLGFTYLDTSKEPVCSPQ